MKFNYGDKLEGNPKLEAEICGRHPCGQPVQINYSDEVSYNVKINGKHFRLRESELDILDLKLIPKAIEPVIEKATVVMEEIPKKRGKLVKNSDEVIINE